MILMYKCPRCGGGVTLDEGAKELACAHCGNRISMFDSEQCESQLIEDIETRDVWFNETIRFSCPSCGSNMICGKEDITSKCAFCGSDVIIDNQLEDEYAPDKLIPFGIDRDRVILLLEKYVESRGFAIDVFEPDKLIGMYVPFWLYNFTGEATIEGHTRLDHDRFKVIRKGKITLERVPLDASIKMNNNLMDRLLPYDCSQLYPFQKGALAGFAAQKYDFRYDEMQGRLDEKIGKFTSTTLKEKMLTALKDPDSVRTIKYRGSGFTVEYDEVHVDNYEYKSFMSDVCYALLPVWQYTVKLDGKSYQIFVNGQTGKIASNLPMTVVKAGGLFAKKTYDMFRLIFIVMGLGTASSVVMTFGLKGLIPYALILAALALVATIVDIIATKKQTKVTDYKEEREGYLMADSFDLYYGVEIPQ